MRTQSSLLEDRCIKLGEYILEHKGTVRSTAKVFGISKSTVHTGVPKGNGILYTVPILCYGGCLNIGGTLILQIIHRIPTWNPKI